MLTKKLFQRFRLLAMRFCYIVIILLSVSSCLPKVISINYESLDLDEILEKIGTENNKRKTLQGIARIRAKNNFDSFSVKQVTILESPHMFRLEAIAAFGQTFAMVVSNGERVVFKTRDEQIVFEDVKKFSLTYFYPGVPSVIGTKELVDLLLGKVPFGLWNQDYDLSVSKKDNLLIVKYMNLNGTQTVLYLDLINECIKAADIWVSGDDVLHIEYLDYINIDNTHFPRKIILNYLSNELKIGYEKDLILNKQIDTSLFLQ